MTGLRLLVGRRQGFRRTVEGSYTTPHAFHLSPCMRARTAMIRGSEPVKDRMDRHVDSQTDDSLIILAFFPSRSSPWVHVRQLSP